MAKEQHDIGGRSAKAIQTEKRNHFVGRMLQSGVRHADNFKCCCEGTPDGQSLKMLLVESRVLLSSPADFGSECKFEDLFDG